MERLVVLSDGRLRFRFKRAWRDGTTNVEPRNTLEFSCSSTSAGSYLFGKDRARELAMIEGKSMADQLEERLVAFGAKIITLSAQLPRTAQGKHIAGQILRSGTAPAPNYGEARGAESRADFIHKLGIALKELNETALWLRMIAESELLPQEKIVDILAENRELAKILTASVKTARSRAAGMTSDYWLMTSEYWEMTSFQMAIATGQLSPVNCRLESGEGGIRTPGTGFARATA